MKNLLGINDYLTEKRVTVKRRYTENYPAKLASTSAKVRNALFDAMADGHLTEEEILKVLSEINANKRWLGRNLSLFNISEDQSGIKTYSLSPYGQRIRNATRHLNEGLNVPYKEKGKKPVNIFVGRFQPFTLGHVKVFEQMYKKNGYPVVVYLVRGGKPDPEKRPFNEDLQQAMFAEMAKQYPFLEAAFVVPNGAIDTLFSTARPAYEPMMWGYGTDRKRAYDAMINKPEYREELGVDPEFSGFEIFRTDDDVSASKVRTALKLDDEATFKRMTPKSIHKFYKTLQDTLQPIKENYKMKHIKLFEHFINESEVKPSVVTKILTNPEDFGEDASLQVYTKGNNVVYIDTFFYGGDDRLKQLKNSWSKGGHFYKYFVEEHGMVPVIEDSFIEFNARGRHKKLSTNGIVGVILSFKKQI